MAHAVLPVAQRRELYQHPEAWVAAVAKRRASGHLLLLDGEPEALTVVMADPGGGLDEVQLVLGRSSEVVVPRLSSRGMGEAIFAQDRLVERVPGLRWDPPDYPGRAVRGKGVFTYPLGPVRADVAESLAYRLQVMGDEIVRLDLQAGFKRRQLTHLAEGQPVSAAAAVLERMTGTSTVAHALAFSQAVEAAMGVEVSDRVAVVRTLLAEWERVHSHLWDLAALAAATGLPVPQMEYLHDRETVLRWAQRLFGHRYLRGRVRPGGIDWRSRPVDTGFQVWREAGSELMRIWEAVTRIRRDLLRTPSFLDRLYGVGRIPDHTLDLVRPVGPIGRAAGLPLDARRWRPYAAYGTFGWPIPIRREKDAYARFRVKAAELEASLLLVTAALDRVHARIGEGWEALALAPGSLPPGDYIGVGVVEAPRGLLAYRVRVTAQGVLRHVAVATPSARNWYVVAPAVANGNILQDFPIMDASFALSAAGWDG